MKKCPKCNEELIEYSQFLIHPAADCDLQDGIMIEVFNDKLQENFQMMAVESEELTTQTFKNGIIKKYFNKIKQVIRK